MDSLTWLGLGWDEEPIRQSQRLEIYKQWAQKLLDSGRAYADNSSEEQLNKLPIPERANPRIDLAECLRQL